MSDENLLPCPFCQSPARMGPPGVSIEYPRWFVECSGDCPMVCHTPYVKKDRAIEIWNNRSEKKWEAIK